MVFVLWEMPIGTCMCKQLSVHITLVGVCNVCVLFVSTGWLSGVDRDREQLARWETLNVLYMQVICCLEDIRLLWYSELFVASLANYKTS